MNSIKPKTWILWALILFTLGLAADYYFLHVLFQIKQESLQAPSINEVATPADASATTIDPSPLPQGHEENPGTPPEVDNFHESLQKCAPEIAAQGLGTPEALVQYLQKTIGIQSEEVSLENFHLTLPDGSQRRIQVVIADNTNSTTKKELRLFKLDPEGYPERLPLKTTDNLKSLLALGSLARHEVRSQFTLKDGSSLSLELHNDQVFEFQFNNQGQLLSCRHRACHCP